MAWLSDYCQVCAWVSGPDVAEAACLRGAGFEPVGQVAGNAVVNFAWWNHEVGAPGRRLRRRYPREFDGMNLDSRSRAYADLLYRGRRTAVERMAAQCAALGGDGVVGVRLQAGPYRGDKRARQFTAAGTAVRAAAGVRAAAPFAACMPAQDFARLLAAGWVPTDIAIGTACTWRDWSAGAAPRRWDDGNRELKRWTEAVTAARAEARDQMQARAARARADGIVLAGLDMSASVHRWGPWRGTGGYCVVELTSHRDRDHVVRADVRPRKSPVPGHQPASQRLTGLARLPGKPPP